VKKSPLVLSDAAIADILEQADWYVAQSGQALARRWEKAVTAAVLRVVSRPAAGTLCRFQSPELRGVRRTTISGFPKHLLFYRLDEGEIFILRVVHGARDLERLL
jgi:toxin ParE1/3/4